MRAAVAPSHVAVGLLIALCALLLLKWLAVVALVAVGLAALIWWARRDPTVVHEPAPRSPAPTAPVVPVTAVAPREPVDDDCSWCGLRGGHRDASGRLVRPRHVHGG